MSEKANLLALSGKVNLPLFGDITHFILESAKASREQIRELSHHCVLFDMEWEPAPVQEKYNFLYLGELLERYEERFGMPLPDLRAIALALGFTNGLLTKEMFVGSQKRDFVEKIKKQADKDIYLTGALYLLGEDAPGHERALLGTEYTATEELIFAMSIFHPDFQSHFQHFKQQLLRLLGKGRTIPVIGNLLLFSWFIREAGPLIKTLRTKDAALFRALCSLQKSFVRPGCHQHDVLLAEGYTTLEIAYANVLAVRSQIFDGEISGLSVVAEKIVVELFRNAIPREEPFPPEVYDQFTLLFRQFEKFHIKCHGAYSLMETLEEQVVIGNPQTFMWLSSLAALSNPIFRCFDILEPKWDSLVALGPEKYEDLFWLSLHEGMASEEIKQRVARYDALTGASYVKACCKEYFHRSFRLLVDKEVIDLWEFFCSNLDEVGQAKDPQVMECIGTYLEKKFSVWSFRFYERFIAEYGIQEIERFFSGNRARIFSPLVEKRYGYGKTDLLLTLHRDFLSEEEHRKVLGWLQEYYFMEQPASYMMLVKAVLSDRFAPTLLTAEEQRALFLLLMEQGRLDSGERNALKRRYSTPEELQAEADAETRKRQEQEQKWEADRVRMVQESYAQCREGFKSVYRFLDGYRYDGKNRLTACEMVSVGLDKRLKDAAYTLDCQELGWFLKICGVLSAHKSIKLEEVENYLQMIKEEDDRDNENNGGRGRVSGTCPHDCKDGKGQTRPALAS